MPDKFKTIKPLIIGVGTAGKRHLEAQLALGHQTGVYTNNPDTAGELRQQPNVLVFKSLEEGLNWANLIHVCTPDDKHTEFVAQALEKGKAVFCEKAFTTSLEEALYLQKLSRQYDSILIIGQNYRLTPTFAETKKRIRNGEIGQITNIETTYLHDVSDYKQRYGNENFLYIGGSHAVDLAQWIKDDGIAKVKAVSSNPLNYDIEITFKSGLKGNIKLDANSTRKLSGTDLIVSGEKEKLISHNKSDKMTIIFSENSASVILPNIETKTTPLEIKIVDNYLLGTNSSFDPLPGVDEAVSVIKVLDAIQRSVSSGKEEVL